MVELLVAMAIVAVLAGLVVSGMGSVGKASKRKFAESFLEALVLACERYKVDNGSYPLLDGCAKIGSGSEEEREEIGRALYRALVPESGTVYLPNLNTKSFAEDPPGSFYLVDPWGEPWGYCMGESSLENPNFPGPAIWSTANKSPQEDWVKNWEGVFSDGQVRD